MHYHTDKTKMGGLPHVKPITKPVIKEDNILLSDSVTVALTIGAWILWGINGTRDWGKDGLKDAIIVGSGLQLAYSTFSLFTQQEQAQ